MQHTESQRPVMFGKSVSEPSVGLSSSLFPGVLRTRGGELPASASPAEAETNQGFLAELRQMTLISIKINMRHFSVKIHMLFFFPLMKSLILSRPEEFPYLKPMYV